MSGLKRVWLCLSTRVVTMGKWTAACGFQMTQETNVDSTTCLMTAAWENGIHKEGAYSAH